MPPDHAPPHHPRRHAANPSTTSTSTSSSSTLRSTHTHTHTSNVRRNLFQQHLTRRPTTSSSSTHTSQETLRLDGVDESDSSSDIVIRDKNGEFEIEELGVGGFEEEGEEEEGREDEKERQRLADAVRHHQRDRNRAPSEPAELLEAVRASLRAKVNALAEDNWMYEAEEEAPLR